MSNLETVHSFNPGVVVDGKLYEIPGWMWVLAFATAGIPWALEAVGTEEFKAAVDAWKLKRDVARLPSFTEGGGI